MEYYQDEMNATSLIIFSVIKKKLIIYMARLYKTVGSYTLNVNAYDSKSGITTPVLIYSNNNIEAISNVIFGANGSLAICSILVLNDQLQQINKLLGIYSKISTVNAINNYITTIVSTGDLTVIPSVITVLSEKSDVLANGSISVRGSSDTSKNTFTSSSTGNTISESMNNARISLLQPEVSFLLPDGGLSDADIITNSTNTFYATVGNSTIPSTVVDLRNNPNMPPIYNQGQVNSDSAAAGCTLIEYHLGYTSQILSVFFLYYNTRTIANVSTNSNNQVHLSDVVTAIEKYGICSENLWPSDPSNETFTETPTLLCYEEAKINNSKLAFKTLNNTLVEMKRAISNGLPFMVSLDIYASFYSDEVKNTGIVPMPVPGDYFVSDHSVVCVGYDDNRQLFIMRNSIGTEWGDKGYFYIPYDYLTSSTLSFDMWIIDSGKKIINPEVYSTFEIPQGPREDQLNFRITDPTSYLSLSLPKSVDLRTSGFMPPIYDQKNLNNCTINAGCCSVEYFLNQKNPEKQSTSLSRLYAYYNARLFLGVKVDKNAGVNFEEFINAVTLVGICSEEMWPYETGTGEPNDTGKSYEQPIADPNYYAERDCYKTGQELASYISLNGKFIPVTKTLDNFRIALNGGWPIMLSIVLFSSIYNLTKKTGYIVPIPGPNDPTEGGHAVVCVGYDDTKIYDKKTNKKGVFIMRNSWGVNWGDKGYFYLPYPYLVPTPDNLKGYMKSTYGAAFILENSN
jgi:C1A family cysteine protease